ncbi:MAG: amidohydrolase family protein, partial [Candidatus Thermoplasmatota archaeon]
LVRPPNSLKHQLLKKPVAKIKSAASTAVKEMIANGTTYYCEFSNIPKISKELRKNSGISGKILYEPVDVMSDEAVCENIVDDNVVNKALKIGAECDGLGISGVCEFSDKALKKLASLSNYLALHVAEHKLSQFRSLRQTGKTEIERAIMLRPKLIVHLTNPIKNDLEVLAKKKIPIVCCPRANSVLGVGVPPVKELLKRNILVALGTDNVMFNSPDIFKELKIVANLIGLAPKETLKLTTINPAKILNLNKGVIEEGKDADLIVLKGLENIYNSYEVISFIVEKADKRNIWKVYCKGKEVYSR